MSSFIEINGIKYYGVVHAAKQVGYSRDYISKLARDKKIVASQVGRQWFVDLSSLQEYVQASEEQLKRRQQELREQRQLERLQAIKSKSKKVRSETISSVRSLAIKSLATAVLVFGVGFGYLLSEVMGISAIRSTEYVSPIALVSQLVTAVQNFPIAVSTTEEVSPDDSLSYDTGTSSEVAMGDLGEGLLLLPDMMHASGTNPAAFFSDDVRIVYDDQNQSYVARVDEEGNVEGQIPYVVVPVANLETP